jgi:hypothetical protein
VTPAPRPGPASGGVVLAPLAAPLAAPVAGDRRRAETAPWNAPGWALFSATRRVLRQALGW